MFDKFKNTVKMEIQQIEQKRNPQFKCDYTS